MRFITNLRKEFGGNQRYKWALPLQLFAILVFIVVFIVWICTLFFKLITPVF